MTPASGAGHSDDELVDAARAGSAAAIDLLHQRHVEGALRFARDSGAPDAVAEQVVAASFERVFLHLAAGRRPVSFQAALLSAIRANIANAAFRDRPAARHSPASLSGTGEDVLARTLSTLDPRAQMLLWRLDVDGEDPATVAAAFAMPVAVLNTWASRARRRVMVARVHDHLRTTSDLRCRRALGGLTPDTVDRRTGRTWSTVDRHLRDCRKCRAALSYPAYWAVGRLDALRATPSRGHRRAQPVLVGVAAACALAAVLVVTGPGALDPVTEIPTERQACANRHPASTDPQPPGLTGLVTNPPRSERTPVPRVAEAVPATSTTTRSSGAGRPAPNTPPIPAVPRRVPDPPKHPYPGDEHRGHQVDHRPDAEHRHTRSHPAGTNQHHPAPHGR